MLGQYREHTDDQAEAMALVSHVQLPRICIHSKDADDLSCLCTHGYIFVHQLRENLEESISQLQTQRLSRCNGVGAASASASTLHTSDLEAFSGSGINQSIKYSRDIFVVTCE